MLLRLSGAKPAFVCIVCNAAQIQFTV